MAGYSVSCLTSAAITNVKHVGGGGGPGMTGLPTEYMKCRVKSRDRLIDELHQRTTVSELWL